MVRERGSLFALGEQLNGVPVFEIEETAILKSNRSMDGARLKFRVSAIRHKWRRSKAQLN